MGRMQSLCDDVWIVDAPVTFAGFTMQTRMTVIRLSDGRLLLHSPVFIDDDLAAELAAAGEVAYLAAPSKYHHLNARSTAQRYPNAKLWVSPGLPAKIKNLAGHPFLSNATGDGWPDEVETILLEGLPAMAEVILYHGRTKTLIVTDLFMNVHDDPSFKNRLLWMAEGVNNRFNVPRLIKLFTKDKKKLAASIDLFRNKPMDRIVLAHGKVVDENVQGELQRALAYLS